MAWVEQIFEDKKFLEYLIKVSIVFGPGFLLIGYFERQIFLQLDWFKLLAFCGLFSVCLVGPLMVIFWALQNALLTYYGWKFNRFGAEKFISETKRKVEDITKSLSVANNESLTAKEKKKIADLLSQTQEQDKELDELITNVNNARQSLSKQRIDFLSVLTDNWTFFGMLFALVFVWVAADYISGQHIHIREVLISIVATFYAVLPLVAVGVWLIIVSSISKRVMWRWALRLIGVAIVLVTFYGFLSLIKIV